MKWTALAAALMFAISVSAGARAETVEDYLKIAHQKDADLDYAGAIAIYDAILKQYPKEFPDVYADRADARSSIDDYKGAIADFNKALALDSVKKPKDQFLNHGVVLKERGNAKRYSDDYKGAIADYTQALALNPKDNELLPDRADVRLTLGDCAGSVSDYSAALATEPEAIYYEGRAIGRICTGDLQGASDDYRIAVQMNKDIDAGIPQRVIHGLYLSAWALNVRLGHKDAADAELAAELANADAPSSDIEQYYDAARYYLGKADESILFSDAAALKAKQPKYADTDDSDAYFYAALKQVADGNKAAALKYFQKGLTFHRHMITVPEQTHAWIKELGRKPH